MELARTTTSYARQCWEGSPPCQPHVRCGHLVRSTVVLPIVRWRWRNTWGDAGRGWRARKHSYSAFVCHWHPGRIGGSCSCAFLDDLHILCGPSRVNVVCDLLATTLHRVVGIRWRQGKTRVWNKGGIRPQNVEDLFFKCGNRARSRC